MKAVFENAIFYSPVLIQNIALSIYGLKTQYIRYGGNYTNYYNTVSAHLAYNQSELNAYIQSTLIKTINDAAENVPYYKALFQRENIHPDSIKSIDDLKRIPILEKEPLREAPKKFIHKTFNSNRLLIVHTTGSTGTPLKIYCNNETRQRNYAFYSRYLNQAGISFKQNRATFGGRIIVPSKQKNPPFWRNSFFQRNILFSSYHLTDANIPSYIRKLTKIKPDYIDTYPSSLYCIASYAETHNINLKGITKAITTSAETLYPEQRKVIEGVFGVPIYDQYGAAEMCIFVGQCKEGNYHIHTDYGVVEFLREDGSQAKAGEDSEIICTSFINPVMPLIRYRIGDTGIYSDRPCGCGSLFPVMEKISGRVDDVITTPDGKKIGRLSPVMKGIPVKEIQFIQKVLSEVEVLVVKAQGYDENTEIELINQLRKRLGEDISMDIKYVDRIHRGKGAKLKSIVSMITPVHN